MPSAPDSSSEESDATPSYSPIYHGGIEVKDGVYAVVENAPTSADPIARQQSDVFMPIEKEVEVVATKDRPWQRKFYLADVEALHMPIAVVPNIGAKSRRSFLVVKQRYEWVEMFKAWLEDSHEHDVIGPEEPIPSNQVVEPSNEVNNN